MRNEKTNHPAPFRPGDSLETKHVDLLVTALSRIRGAPGFDCSGPLCICSGDDDCNDMFTTGLCGDAICFSDSAGNVVCLCIRN
jgi:hypothetical protein